LFFILLTDRKAYVTYSPLPYPPHCLIFAGMKSSYTKTEHNYLREVGLRIREARQNLGLSQETFAKTCDLDKTYISDVERGERNISILNLKKIADALKAPMAKLIS
jgi:ribosome-binding protein aMBF1 (putative translation factor)